MSALLEGRGEDAAKEVEHALESGWSALRIYQEIFTPALREVGSLWEQGQIGVAKEHYAVQATLKQMVRIRSHFNPAAATGKRVLVATTPGEPHCVGASMAADFFELNGLAVDFLGADTPVKDIVDYVQQQRNHLVALSVTLAGCLKGVSAVISQLRKKRIKVPVLLGGVASAATRSWKRDIRPNAVAEDPLQGFIEACRLLNLDRAQISFATLLTRVGRRIETLRKEKQWNQQELADRTGLDRTYISALECGKQNATIKVLLKLSEAFEVPFASLFAA